MADDTVAVAAVGILVAIAAKETENRKRKRTILDAAVDCQQTDTWRIPRSSARAGFPGVIQKFSAHGQGFL